MHHNDGNIPVLISRGYSLAKAWEESLIDLYTDGGEVATQYDGPGDRLSRDATHIVIVGKPSSEPAIHRAFPGGLDALEEYRLEVVDGIKDHWVRNPLVPDDTRWDYTYHNRLTAYKMYAVVEDKLGPATSNIGVRPVLVNQIADLIDALTDCHYTRRATVSTWNQNTDPGISDPPCLQSIWCRVLKDSEDQYVLNMNVRFRSRDAYDAAFMNMWALICLMEEIAKKLSERYGSFVRLGRYMDQSDSYHIYGRRLDHFEDGFLKLIKDRSFEDRTWTREFAQPFFDEARPKIMEKVKEYDERK